MSQLEPVIVGLAAHFHDSACCVLVGGRLAAAAQEERFTRVKHDSSLPRNAFRWCLANAGLTIADVDCIAWYEDPVAKLDRQLWMGLPQVPPAAPPFLFRLDAARPARELRELLGWDGRIEFVPHHVAHAASAFDFSGFRDAAILTVDAVGEWTTTSYGRGHELGIDLFEEVEFPHSLGLFYSAITSYLGFDVNDAEYKVMGLAPYGRPQYVDQMRMLVENVPGGRFRLDLEYFDFLGGARMFSDALCALFGRPPREPESELDAFTRDIARSAQVVLEEILLAKAAWLHEQVGSPRLCMAGGVALNCVANGRILREGPFEELFVQPAASDAGAALGAATITHRRMTGAAPPVERLAHVFLGPAYSGDEIRAVLRGSGVTTQVFPDQAALCDHVAERLACGEVIGWFRGAMEFGPRALGARSILADPRNPAMRDRVNAFVKKREGFRPFAPAVIAERAGEHFDLDHDAPFMLETCQVRSALDLPAITHVDGSARPQTVEAGANPGFHALLRAFERRTGCPILLNTSFNLRGEPIVCTPIDALLCFVRSDLDCLVLEDTVIDRRDVPPAWIEAFRDTPARRTGVSHTVYTLL
ncbi:MAG TPA: carbamoyltransferase [Vicinamibacterales bacterium]|nr:carbamoyltransferase [Vicinamibacterales bacterium]